MKKLSTEEIRRKWIDFFKTKNHYELPYSSLIPIDDPSLLWINSGVATLKPFFEGKKNPPSKRLVNSQKSIRTNDIENVGYTTRHHTLFEMLGNFSIGDYFKKEAIEFAWEFLTSSKWLNINKEKLYVTVYEKDETSYDIWTKNILFPKNKIIKGTKAQNFWEIGSGPSGPNTEIFYDRGPKYDPKNLEIKLLKDDIENDRYLEVWNIVFSEFNSDGNGNYTLLPRQNIDTGAGLERFATVLQDVPTSFDIDIFQVIIHEIEKITNNEYKYDINNYFIKDHKQEVINTAFKIIADHIRAIVFTIADGVYPSNKNQGYVIRRLIRRSSLYARKLNIHEPFLYKLVNVVIKVMGSYYEYLKNYENNIKETLFNEEKRFLKTLKQGEAALKEMIKNKKTITAAKAFMLFESFGFPFELTQKICAANNILLKKNDFNKYLEKHQQLAQQSQKKVSAIKKQDDFLTNLNLNTTFVGYEQTSLENAKIIFAFKDKKKVDILNNELGYIILDKTPFYAEKGGQAADEGIFKGRKFTAKVLDVQLGPNNENIHYVKVKGLLKLNDLVSASVNCNKRTYTMKNHSGTHILHSAIREVLGESAMQIGSYNDDKHLRIDISSNKKISKTDFVRISTIAQENILKKIPCQIIYCKYEDAINKYHALAFFKDKYDFAKDVRIVKFADVSVELCGGTHVKNSSEIETLLITKCNSIGSNVYRFNALTSFATVNKYLTSLKENLINQIKEIKAVKANLKHNISDDIKIDLNNPIVTFNKISKNLGQLAIIKAKLKKQLTNQIMQSDITKYQNIIPQSIQGIDLIIANTDNLDKKTIKGIVELYRNKYKTNTIMIFNNIINDNKGTLYFAITKDLESTYHSGKMITKINAIINGKGGGNSMNAQSGYSDFVLVQKLLKDIGKILK